MVSWLPIYHDMGLIGGVLGPLYAGGSLTLLSPKRFQENPLAWLEAISRYQATHAGGPNFAYDWCLRRTTAAEARETRSEPVAGGLLRCRANPPRDARRFLPGIRSGRFSPGRSAPLLRFGRGHADGHCPHRRRSAAYAPVFQAALGRRLARGRGSTGRRVGLARRMRDGGRRAAGRHRRSGNLSAESRRADR